MQHSDSRTQLRYWMQEFVDFHERRHRNKSIILDRTPSMTTRLPRLLLSMDEIVYHNVEEDETYWIPSNSASRESYPVSESRVQNVLWRRCAGGGRYSKFFDFRDDLVSFAMEMAIFMRDHDGSKLNEKIDNRLKKYLERKSSEAARIRASQQESPSLSKVLG